MIPGDVAYVLSLKTKFTTSANLLAQIVDLKTGQKICQKEISQPLDICKHTVESSFVLAGSERRLAYCGGTAGGKCYLLTADSLRQKYVVGPTMSNHASVVSNGQWILIGAK